MPATRIIIVLAIAIGGFSEIVTVELANGGVSRPLVIEPLPTIQEDSEFSVLPNAAALSFDAQNNGNQDDGHDRNNSSRNEDMLMIKTFPEHEVTISQHHTIINPDTENQPNDIITNIKSKYSYNEGNQTKQPDTSTEFVPTTTRLMMITNEPVVTSSITPSVTTTMKTSPLFSVPPTSTKTSSHHPSTHSPSQTTKDPIPQLPCHQSCLEALNATQLNNRQNLLLSQGSDLTLVCEIPLNPSFNLEDLIWLHHPDNSVAGQCSLTSQEFIHKCEGFQTINDTKDRNSTFVRDSITIANLLTSNSGHYMCQVKVTCCSESQQHSMSQEHITHIKVQVWLADYTVDLAIAGSVTVILAIIFIGGSYYISQKQRAHYTFITNEIQEIKPATVLHIPLVDDKDTDSFDSNFDEQD